MTHLKVALLQMTGCGSDQTANLEKGEVFCRRAAQQGADIALFPEMWNIGYQSYDEAVEGSQESWIDQSIGRDSDFIRHHRSLARELEMALAVTYLETWPGGPRNSVSLIDRHGDILFTYGKVHTCCYEHPEVVCTPGVDFHTAELDTRVGPVRTGAMICYDREFPESARLLMIKGAELILTPNACSLAEFDRIRIHQFRSRAFENMVAAAMTNYAAPQHDGHSLACNPDGSVVAMADGAEDICMVSFDLDFIRNWRKTRMWGDAFRRPSVYAPLADSAVAEPFVRTDLYDKPLTHRRNA
jgi:N-carbamoylputrescine amidase